MPPTSVNAPAASPLPGTAPIVPAAGTPVGTPPVTPATPVSTVSSTPAATMVNSQIIPTMNNAANDIETQNATRTGTSIGSYQGVPITPGTDSQVQAQIASIDAKNKKVTPAPTSTTSQTGQSIDEAVAGMQPIYNATTGERQLNPIGSPIPPGFTINNPTSTPIAPTQAVSDSAMDAAGNTFKYFADGTYGKFDATGTYAGTATATDFADAKTGQELKNSLNQAIHGTYPLTSDQQASIAGLQAKFNQIIEQQKIANENFTGGTTVAQNLYGMGNSLVGLSAIKSSVDAGINKIADLNSQMVSAVADMRSAFQKDNLAMLKTGYDIYSQAAKDRQDEIDKLHAAADAKAKDLRDFNQAITDKINTVAAEAAKNGAPASILAAINASKNQSAAISAAGNYLQSSSDAQTQQYINYSRRAQEAGHTPMQFDDWKAKDDARQMNLKVREAYATAAASEQGRQSVTGSKGNQQKLEQQGRAVIEKELSNRSGGLGIQDAKVNQAIHLKSLFDQYKVTTPAVPPHLGLFGMTGGSPAKTVYNIPPSAYSELAIGVANLLSSSNVATDSTINSIRQATAEGNIGKALTYATGQPMNGSSQAIFQQLKDSVDRQGTIAQQERQTYVDNLANLLPTDLDADRRAALLSGSTLNNYVDPNVQAETQAKDQITAYRTAHPDQTPIIRDRINALQQQVGRPITTAELLQVYPEYAY